MYLKDKLNKQSSCGKLEASAKPIKSRFQKEGD